jgi:hypothetical protein
MVHLPRCPRYPQDTRIKRHDFPKIVQGYSKAEGESIMMGYRPNEIAIDEIVASCDGDVRGALKALLLVNEQLEAEIVRLYAAVSRNGSFERGGGALH